MIIGMLWKVDCQMNCIRITISLFCLAAQEKLRYQRVYLDNGVFDMKI
jgi:hypothetical protein